MLGVKQPLSAIAQTKWDMVIVGGGITGAGIAMQAAQLGFKVLLLEQKDFAWGTSSRSSKMVHGGLRYLAQGDVLLTRHSLKERERLLVELPDLVVRMGYFFPLLKGRSPSKLMLRIGLMMYDLLAGIRDHRWVAKAAFTKQFAQVKSSETLQGAMYYTDALTDDARLVMQTLHEAAQAGAVVRNYTKVKSITQSMLSGTPLLTLDIADEQGETASIIASHVFNATGLWADNLSQATPRIRPQRGSHLLFAADKLPLSQSLTLVHPKDGRPVFVYPWKGVTCVGTTDLDHKNEANQEPTCSNEEVSYLLELLNDQFPAAQLQASDIVSHMAGVRPIIASGKGLNPSQESRGHSVWKNGAIISVSGGKLTTFRLIAIDALAQAKLISKYQAWRLSHSRKAFFSNTVAMPAELRLGLNSPIANIPTKAEAFAQLNWCMHNEMVSHLDDLLLRRTRLANVLGAGIYDWLPDLTALLASELGWSEAYINQEVLRFGGIMAEHYGVPMPAKLQSSTV